MAIIIKETQGVASISGQQQQIPIIIKKSSGVASHSDLQQQIPIIKKNFSYCKLLWSAAINAHHNNRKLRCCK